ncbi:AAA family ATPase [Devosia sp. A16]|uniref:AAA family ATPase n=1 Tax=Devosia sp. A16 TaxID=1736675 RepID=UPI0006D7D08A|nr:AAA family ATPase [Devosia sp. A16]
MAREFILTGAPGAGKTVIVRALEAGGIDVVEEAATDVIALDQGRGIDESWRRPEFIDDIARLQLQRAARPATGNVRVSDRSLVCTLALAEYLGHPVPDALIESIASMVASAQYERRVLFVDLLGFITRTEARRISLDESRRFERFHIAAYERLGFELVRIPALPLEERVAMVRSLIGLGIAPMVNGV